MKEQRVSGSTDPLILYLSTRWRLSVKPHVPATLLLEWVPSSHWIGGCVGCGASLDVLEKK